MELVRDRKQIEQVEFVFFDHWQALYQPDQWLFEGLGVSKPGLSMLVADNVIAPGARECTDWVKATPQQKRRLIKRMVLMSLTPDADLEYEPVVTEFDTDFEKVGQDP